MSDNGTNDEAVGLMLEQIRRKPDGVISPSPENIKIRGLPAEKLERCPFCSMILNLPEAMRRAIIELADAAASSL